MSPFEKDDRVLVKEGPFRDYRGVVDKVMPDRRLIRIIITLFGRQAPIELEEHELEKLDAG